MASYHYDVVVIGSGPAGEGASINLVKHGRRVAVVENKPVVGGNCAHLGTIPSKALRHAIKQLIQYNTSELFRQLGDPNRFSFKRIAQSAQRIVEKQVNIHSSYYGRNRVDIYVGTGRFIDSNTIEVVNDNSGVDLLTADKFVIATGSRPYQPSDVNFDHPRIYDSDSILTLSHPMRSLIIYGAGVIGCEYASIFSGLGVKVDLVNTRDRLLSFLDDEISDALSYHLRDNGVLVRHNEEMSSVEVSKDGLTLHLSSGKRISGDALLWCNGRTGNTDQLQLEQVGLEPNSRGQLDVDQHYRTNVDHIYAVGDVIGYPSLASAAFDQGRSAAADMLNSPDARFVDDIPTGIYTIPEISSIGRTERELTSAKVPYEVGRALFKNIARAQITGNEVGVLKLLFHADTFEILGVHCFGAEASEIIHIGQAIMRQSGEANTIKYFVNTTFNYPTMAEAYRIAALDGLNRILRHGV